MVDSSLAIPAYGDEAVGTNSVCWGFTGSNGGAGVTSLCIQFAHETARICRENNEQKKICLFDLDFENGSVAQYLDLVPNLTLEDLQADYERVDVDLLDSLVTRDKRGFDVLALNNVFQANEIADPNTVLMMLDNLNNMYDFLILDIPRIWTPWTQAAIGGSDRLCMLTELSIPALHVARNRCADFYKAVDDLGEIDIIINKHDRRSFRNPLKLGDVEDTLQTKISAVIHSNFTAVREAINRGEPVGACSQDSRYSKDTRAIIKSWVDIARAEEIASRGMI